MPQNPPGHPVFRLLNPDGAPSVLLVCDHASNYIPPEDSCLGLPEAAFSRHIAYDIGAAEVTEILSRLLNCPAVLAGFSRLLIDPNRGEDDPTLVMKLSDGAIIPGNRHLDAQGVSRRKARYYAPYHQAIAGRINAARARGLTPALLSIHSFTPVFQGRARPWHIGVLWDRDDRIARPLLTSLTGDRSLCIGDNQPYSGELTGDCMNRHGTSNGLPHVLIELRQDLISDRAGAEHWAALLVRHLQPILKAIR
ncbi:MAG: N-formylglutamate amidohydrolase [Pseudomonadota bacterium]|jgi:predicted N-formylglutamate amidohydrolase